MFQAKRLLALLMSLITAASLFLITPAAGAISVETAQQVVSALGIMVGDGSGNMNLDSTLSRAQMAKILVRLSSGAITLGTATSPFPDVPYTSWEAPYVSQAVSQGLISGCPDGTFKPDDTATTEQFAQTLLSVLGYTSSDYGVGWPWAQMNFAQKLGLFNQVTAQVGTNINRRNVMLMLYNTLNATAKSGKKYAVNLGYSTTASGDLDIASIITANSVGPITVKSTGWFDGTGLNSSTATVYLNDTRASFSAIQTYDIVYYSVNMNTIWAYNKKITGVLQNALPNRLSPTSLVVSGATYTVGTTAAASALSYTGGFKVGDVVTLLLDRNGYVADVLPADSATTLTGYVTGSGNKQYTAEDGSLYYSYYISLITIDGTKLEYQVSYDPATLVGKAVTISFKSGVPQVVSSASASVSGTVSAAGMTLGSAKLSADVKILDVDNYGNYVSLAPTRLNGVTLTADNILYCQTDASGAITQLMLNAVTGDTAIYGLLTSAPTPSGSSSFNIGGTYTYNINGTTGSLTVSGTLFSATTGPAAFTYQGTTLKALSSLTSLGTVTFSGSGAVVTTSGARHTLMGTTAYYQRLSDGTYSYISASKAEGLTLTAYYDKPESRGGSIRIIIAE